MKQLNNLNNLGELDVVYKYRSKLSDRPKILNSNDSVTVLKRLFNKDKIGMQEQFVVIYLNRSNHVIGCSNLFIGGIGSMTIETRIIVSLGLKLLASGVIISHNHPSGNLEPSKEDLNITNKIKLALELLDMKLLDHIIVTPDFRFKSFVNEGLL